MKRESFNSDFDEVERYELREDKPYAFEADRREFVQLLGSGLVFLAVANQSGSRVNGQERGQRQARRAQPLSQRFHLGDDGILTVFTSKVEVGQGARTQLSQAAAEELHLPIERIRLVMADTELCPDDGGTAGSRTTPSTVPSVRNAAAAAYKVLIELAAKQLEVEASEIQFANGTFSTASDKKLTLSELASNKAAQERFQFANPESDMEVVSVKEWSVLGTDVDKVGGADVVTGAATYPSDIVLEGMLYGKVLRPISFGAKLQEVDISAVETSSDVVVVHDGDFVGCTAENSWEASKLISKLRQSAKWEETEQPSSDDLFDVLKNTARESRGRRRNGGEQGDVEAALANANKTISTRYTVAYVQHAPMEPRAAVAQWNDGKLTVWTGTQQPSRVHSELCRSFGLPENRVRVIVPDTGGGFGGKHTGEAAVEAARLAKKAGRPVHIRWTREEEFTWAYFRPAGLIEVSAGLDEDGKLNAWDFANYNSGGSALETPYRVANRRERFLASDAPLRQGSYRALASTANTFARESAMDEMALLATTDPLSFRLSHLDEGRLKDVLKAAADKFDWRSRRAKVAKNRGVGLACGTEKGSFTAACVEVEVNDNQLNILQVCQAFECGAIQNPGILEAQVRGSLIMGLGGALFEEMQFKGGKISNPRFSSYRVPRMNDVPELDIVLVNRKDLPSVGAGETPIIAIAPALANAIQHATGKRCRSMPIKLS